MNAIELRTVPGARRAAAGLLLPAAMAALAVLAALGSAPAPLLAQPEPSPTVVERAGTPDLPDQPPTPRPSATRTPPPTETPYPPSATPSPTLGAPSPSPTEPPETGVIPNEERPIIVVTGFDTNPDRPSPNSSFILSLFVANTGERYAENVRLTLSSTTFLPQGQGGLLFINHLDEGEDTGLDVQMRVSAEAKAGVYPISIGLRWDDSYGGEYSDEMTIGIEVGPANSTRPLLTVTGTRLPGRVAPGIPFEIALDLLNTGGEPARNVTVVPASGPLALQGVPGGPLDLAPGASASLRLRAAAADSGTPGAVSQLLELRYDDPDGQRLTETVSVGLVVTGDAALSPGPMVTGYRVLQPGREGGGAPRSTLAPGEVFLLVLDILNTGPSDALRTRLSFGGGTAPGAGTTGTTGGAASGTSLGVFAPVGTSNVRFLDRIAAGAATTVEQTLVIDGSAKPGVYVLELAFDYLDGQGRTLSTSEVVSLLVDRRVDFEIRPVDVVTSTTAGIPMNFAVELINLGTNTVNVANAEVLPGRSIAVLDPATARQYIGPLDGGGFAPIETQLLPETPGKSQIQVAVEYFDSFNQLQTATETFDLTIEEAPPEPEMDPDAEEEAGSPGLLRRLLMGFLGLGASGEEADAGEDGVGDSVEDGAGSGEAEDLGDGP